MIDQSCCSLIRCTVIGTLTKCAISEAKLFAMTSIASTNSVSGMLTGGTAKTGVGCHGTALGFRLVNPGRASQHRGRLSTGKLCQGAGGGRIKDSAECCVLSSSPCKPNDEGKLACDRGVLSGVLGISSELFDASEHPSVEAWLSGLENGNTNSVAAFGDGFLV